MSYYITNGVAIAGIAAAVPRKTVSVDSYVNVFGSEVVEKFKQKTGILTLHRTGENQTAGDLGYSAANHLLEKLSIARDDIGVLVFVSQAPDYRKPATACVLQYRLGLSIECAAFDVGLGCSGFVYGDRIIRALMMSGQAKYGLLIVAETSSKQAGEKDKTMAMMFGDAGSAILYEKGVDGQSTTLLQTDGSRYKNIIVPAGGFRDLHPELSTFKDSEGTERSKFEAYMDGMAVFEFSIRDVPNAMNDYLEYIGKQGNDFDYILLHQANHYIIKQIAKRFKVPMDKVPISLDRYGNTSGVTIPLTICDKFGSSATGDVSLLAAGFGIGLSLGVTSFKLDIANVFPIIEDDEAYIDGRF